MKSTFWKVLLIPIQTKCNNSQDWSIHKWLREGRHMISWCKIMVHKCFFFHMFILIWVLDFWWILRLLDFSARSLSLSWKVPEVTIGHSPKEIFRSQWLLFPCKFCGWCCRRCINGPLKNFKQSNLCYSSRFLSGYWIKKLLIFKRNNYICNIIWYFSHPAW